MDREIVPEEPWSITEMKGFLEKLKDNLEIRRMQQLLVLKAVIHADMTDPKVNSLVREINFQLSTLAANEEDEDHLMTQFSRYFDYVQELNAALQQTRNQLNSLLNPTDLQELK